MSSTTLVKALVAGSDSFLDVTTESLVGGYHEFLDVRRNVLTRVENKKVFAKSPILLSTILNVDAGDEIWKAGCA